MSYSIKIKGSATKSLSRVDPRDRRHLIEAIDRLADQAAAGAALKGEFGGLRRLRVGRYRIVCEALHEGTDRSGRPHRSSSRGLPISLATQNPRRAITRPRCSHPLRRDRHRDSAARGSHWDGQAPALRDRARPSSPSGTRPSTGSTEHDSRLPSRKIDLPRFAGLIDDLRCLPAAALSTRGVDRFPGGRQLFAVARGFVVVIFVALVVATWWAAREIVPESAAVAAIAPALVVSSPFVQLFAAQAMLELPGALLYVLCLGAYARTCAPAPARRWWRPAF